MGERKSERIYEKNGHGKQNDDKNLSIAYQMTSSPYTKYQRGCRKNQLTWLSLLGYIAFVVAGYGMRGYDLPAHKFR